MKFNVNDQARVTLTAYGRGVYHRFNRRLVPAFQMPTSSTIELPLWEIMQVFGPVLTMGMRWVPFVDNAIEIVRWKPGARRTKQAGGTWLPLPTTCRSPASRRKDRQ